MGILRADNLQKSFGTRTLFRDVSFEIQPGERVGLIGVNGSGKTTLFRILLGKERADNGIVSLAPSARITEVEQRPDTAQDVDLFHFTLEAFSELLETERTLNEIVSRIDREPEQRSRLIARQDVLLETFDRRGGNTFRSRTRSALLGLGFSEADLVRPIGEFSGGQVSKAMLARAILTEADILLLDEPTNNLDVAAIRWLEEYLKEFRGAVLVVSHDRAFLDATVTRILELSQGTIHSTPGNYTRYTEQKLSARERAEKLYFRQQKEIKRIEGIIAQQRRWNQERNYVTIASKQKQIDRIKAEMVPPEKDEKHIVFRFPEPKPTGNEVIELRHLAKQYGDTPVFSDLDLMIRKGECVCLIGENGCGKSTLLKILVGEEAPTGGTYRLGAGVRIGYYAQHTDDLHDEKTILNELYDTFPQMTPNELRGYLGMFLFRGDDIEKEIGTLSGGERARIQLLKLVLSGANVLLLDEPTNHLDIASSEVLEHALEQFEGTILIVSHDRYLVNRLSDRVILLSAEGLMEQTDESENLFDRIRPAQRTVRTEQKDRSENHYLKQKEAKTALLQARQSLKRIEQEIEHNDAEREQCQKDLLSATERGDYQLIQSICDRLTVLQQKETELYERLETAEEAYNFFNREETK
ncbi:MAG: ABC-F family ATP-binding cassette domain-containing protein [Clostridia bacterium]|jgi:ATP-binding cassette subfamily F protein 3|nr:ABC-F family ATP-binding cassette domain-containing protein [Clostridia bacterium]